MTHISIFDPQVKSILIQENSEPLVDVTTIQGIHVSQKYEPYYPTFKLVRQSVAHQLEKAIEQLPQNISILFVEGHRPLKVQEAYFSQYYDALKARYPEWSDETVFYETTKLIAPPSNLPPHSTGGAIDITLCDENGDELDMGSPIDDDPDQNDGRNLLDASNISTQAQNNRKLLKKVMSDNGFANYDYEWWHWSYGDQYWAFKTNCAEALYDSADASTHNLWQEPVIMNLLASTGV